MLCRQDSLQCNSLPSLYPGIAQEWDYCKNDGDPGDYTASSNVVVWWKSRDQKSWQQSVSSRTDNRLERHRNRATWHVIVVIARLAESIAWCLQPSVQSVHMTRMVGSSWLKNFLSEFSIDCQTAQNLRFEMTVVAIIAWAMTSDLKRSYALNDLALRYHASKDHWLLQMICMMVC